MDKRRRVINASSVYILAIVSLLVFLYSFFGALGIKLLIVSGNSMHPTYKDGQIVIAVSSNYIEENYPVCWVEVSGRNVLKRLIGYPGDHVELIDGDTYVNGKLIIPRSTNSWDNMEFQLTEDQYLFIGDNREDSIDSRHWITPYVHRSQIKGVVHNSGLSGGEP